MTLKNLEEKREKLDSLYQLFYANIPWEVLDEHPLENALFDELIREEINKTDKLLQLVNSIIKK